MQLELEWPRALIMGSMQLPAPGAVPPWPTASALPLTPHTPINPRPHRLALMPIPDSSPSTGVRQARYSQTTAMIEGMAGLPLLQSSGGPIIEQLPPGLMVSMPLGDDGDAFMPGECPQ